ncbi:MAG: hypothetical protein K2I74_08800 [Treponemataceae bacterium]|nr:hypothetical protein [Treponemataceae bacterium]
MMTQSLRFGGGFFVARKISSKPQGFSPILFDYSEFLEYNTNDILYFVSQEAMRLPGRVQCEELQYERDVVHCASPCWNCSWMDYSLVVCQISVVCVRAKS